MRRQLVTGPAGALETKLHRADNADAPVVIVLHPNPQFGGNMNTPSVYNLFTAFADAGYHACRFNYRGVGRSEGDFSAGGGEVEDAKAILDWLREQDIQTSSIWIAGFSYGAWIATELIKVLGNITGSIMIAPPVQKYDFITGDLPVEKALLIHGDADNLIPLTDVRSWADSIRLTDGSPLTLLTVEGADHFFNNHQQELTNILKEFIPAVA